MISRSEEEKSSMVDFRLYVWEWIRFTEIALCGGNEDPRGTCEQPSNYPKVLPHTASGWDIWMQKGFIWRAFFQRSEILLVLARNTLIRIFTQEIGSLITKSHASLRKITSDGNVDSFGGNFFWEKMLGVPEIFYKSLSLIPYQMICITGGKKKKNETLTEEGCNKLFWPFQNKFFRFAVIIALLYRGGGR